MERKIDTRTDKKVLKKMVLMYIKDNMNTQTRMDNMDIIIEEVMKELIEDKPPKRYIDKEKYSFREKDIEHHSNELSYSPDMNSINNWTNSDEQTVTFTPSPVPTYFLCIRRQSYLFRVSYVIYYFIMDKFNNQETYQRYQAISNVLIELFRVITSSLMILFVPQKCGSNICSLQQIITNDTNIKFCGLVINYITLFSFIILYCIEVWRENRLIKYLDVNPNMPTDSEYITTIMNILPQEKKEKILKSNKYYTIITYITIFFYIINVIISGIVINKAYLSNQTYATFITYVIFMITKLTNSYTVVNTGDENIFYSAYLKVNVQFNDIDRNYKKIIDL
jgi:hypothetical protein